MIIKNKKGFIFLITLLIMLVSSLLILTSMQHLLLHYKSVNNQEELHQRFYQLENVAMQLAKRPLKFADKTCLLNEDLANEVLNNLIHGGGCSLQKNFLYHYYIEDLGDFSCLIVFYKGQKRATHHRRISVVQVLDGIPKLFLQIRYIAPGDIRDCTTQERLINLGVSSWRYLPLG